VRWSIVFRRTDEHGSQDRDDHAPIAWPQSPREEGGEVSYEQWT